MSSLRLLKETTGSSVSSIELTDIFSSDYDIYKINVLMDGSTTNKDIRFRYLNSSGGVVLGSSYTTAAYFMGTYTSFLELRYAGQSSHLVTGYNYDGGTGIDYTIFSPFDNSSYTFMISQSNGAYNSSGVKAVGIRAIAVHEAEQSNTGIQIVPSTSTLENITVRAFGLRVD
tara:strand:+ start:461 stop:976 length:516 start_codon:yes stop_codon:yes gene_type:complete